MKNNEHSENAGALDRRRFLGAASASVAGLAVPGVAGTAWAGQAPPPDDRRDSPGEIRAGSVKANGLNFGFLEQGKGPLAMCLHGYPDSPHTYRYLMPALASAGYRAVSHFNRGYYPTDAPKLPYPEGYHVRDLMSDVLAIKDALGGDENSVLIAHDWGAIHAWAVANQAPNAFRRIVIMNVPPLLVFSPMLTDYPQIRRSFYFWWLQMPYSSTVYAKNNYAFVDHLWEDWSPGYDHTEDVAYHKKCYQGGLRDDAVLGTYRNLFEPEAFFSTSFTAEHTLLWGKPTTAPVLYMHGTNDGCIVLDDKSKALIPPFIPNPLSRIQMVEGVGHFMLVQRPDVVNGHILEFLKG